MRVVKQSATLDSSFWINAHRAGLLPAVLRRYVLYYPVAVGTELVESFPSGREFWRLARAGNIGEVTTTLAVVHEFGPGEREAINVALAHPDWVLLMDDRRPLEAATRLGLNVLCTPVLTVALAMEGSLSAAEAVATLARLAAMQTVSPTLITAAAAQLAEWLPPGQMKT